MTTTNTFIGMNETTRLSSRVLKPPGGGSSISFDEADGFHPRPAPVRQLSQESPKKSPVMEKSPVVEKTPEKPEAPTEPKTPEKIAEPKPEEKPTSPTTNGKQVSVSSSPQTGTNGTTVSNGSPETPKAPPKEVLASPIQESPKIPNIEVPPQSPPQTNGTSHSSPMSTTPSSPKENWPTPDGLPSKSPDTKTRLFGDAPPPPVVTETPTRPVKDRMKSSIFTYEEEALPSPRSNGTPVAEPKTSPAPNSAPRQRVPPGGYSTKLW